MSSTTTPSVDDRLTSRGITIPDPPSPVAIYVPAVQTGNYIYTSGQLPTVRGELVATGKVGAEVSPEQAAEAARQCTLNALAAIRSLVGDLSRVIRVVKAVGYVASADGFTGQSAVMNGASTLLGEVFGDHIGSHARSAVGVAALPLGAPVEVELVVEVAPPR